MDRLRVGVISDVHSNLPALEAVLESIEAAGPEEIWCLGDVVGYGAQPDECTALVRERCAVSLNGNHDLAVTGGDRRGDLLGDGAGGGRLDRSEHASAETIEWLAELSPEGAREGFGLFHASPRDPIWEYVLSIDQAEAGLDAQERADLPDRPLARRALLHPAALDRAAQLRHRRPGGRRRPARPRPRANGC